MLFGLSFALSTAEREGVCVFSAAIHISAATRSTALALAFLFVIPEGNLLFASAAWKSSKVSLVCKSRTIILTKTCIFSYHPGYISYILT